MLWVKEPQCMDNHSSSGPFIWCVLENSPIYFIMPTLKRCEISFRDDLGSFPRSQNWHNKKLDIIHRWRILIVLEVAGTLLNPWINLCLYLIGLLFSFENLNQFFLKGRIPEVEAEAGTWGVEFQILRISRVWKF